jgi:hypothetical protein
VFVGNETNSSGEVTVSEKASVNTGATTGASAGDTSVGHLAQFFPSAIPVRFPVNIIAAAGESERTTIEFGTSREVLFASRLPLEFGQRVRLRNLDASLDVEACIVAMQLHSGRTAVAAQFIQEVANWIVKP